MRYKPQIGTDLPITKELIVAKTNQITEVTRSLIALSLVLFGAVALVFAVVFCAYRGDFQVLQTLWAILAAPLGWIIGYYFRGNGPNGKTHNESTA